MEELDGSGRGTSINKNLEEKATVNTFFIEKKIAERRFAKPDEEDFLDEVLGLKHETAGTRDHTPLNPNAVDLTQQEPQGKVSGFGRHLATKGKASIPQNEDEDVTGFASAINDGIVQEQVGMDKSAYYGEEKEESGGLSQNEKEIFQEKDYSYPSRKYEPVSRPPKLHDQIREPMMTQSLKKENDDLESEVMRKKRLQADLQDIERKIRGE